VTKTVTNTDSEDSMGKVNILLVDDREQRLMSYEAILAELGENMVRADSGAAALRLLMEEDFAVVLLDVNMPGMDGFETADLIHQHPRFEKTPIIFVSAVNTSDMDRLRGYKLGAIDYVSVPIIPEVLRSKVSVLVELHRKRRALERLNRDLAGENAELVRTNLALETKRAQELERLNANLEQVNYELGIANQALKLEIMERRRVEERLRELDRRKDEFLATLAHELRNPLAPLLSGLETLRLARGEPELGERARGIMERQLKTLVRLVDDLLDVSRITRGRLELRTERVTLDSVVSSAIESTRPLLESLGHRLLVDVPHAAPTLNADPQRLAQVFGNLLNNAAKYTDRGGHVWLSVWRDGGEVVVSVRDDGIGLAPDLRAQVFDAFVQADTSLERSRGGLGIGLTLVRQLVQMHGGTVEARSAGVGKGSEFLVRLPVAEADTAPVQGLPTHTGAAAGSKRIVVVDDNRDAADTLALSLSLLGHEVRVSYDATEVVDLAAAWRPHMMFLDVGMPKVNGFELARRLRSQPWAQDVLLVALTGWGKDEDRRQSFEAGFDHHLVKPAELNEIERLCRGGATATATVS